MYQGLFDDKHFMVLINMNSPIRKSLKPTGLYDKHILCNKCDGQVIGSLESFAKKVLHGGRGRPENYHRIERGIDQQGYQVLRLENVDYTKFKLFLLSIIWRASISRQPFFKSTALGQYEEVIRGMVLSNSPGEESDFSVGLMRLTKSNTQPTKLIAPPIPIAPDNKNLAYILIVNEIAIFCKIAGKEDSELYEEISIKKDGSMNVYR